MWCVPTCTTAARDEATVPARVRSANVPKWILSHKRRFRLETVVSESGNARHVERCDGEIVDGRLSVAFSRPLAADSVCTYAFDGGGPNGRESHPCDRAVAVGKGAQSVLVAYHASEPCVPGRCDAQHAPSVRLAIDWQTSFLVPDVPLPTAVESQRRVRGARLPPQVVVRAGT